MNKDGIRSGAKQSPPVTLSLRAKTPGIKKPASAVQRSNFLRKSQPPYEGDCFTPFIILPLMITHSSVRNDRPLLYHDHRFPAQKTRSSQ
ncbi:hypothetical protein JXO59_00340 [candidate division KSB1 bacterium]|nr:hypothetical protein [candidate division KSB1 bacterium]